ncbi:transporter [Seonamhaeicola marinus]|uniref:Transporter n=1 Tax=Seonamhaeicola marinus TaxID=1912246 RepID=A0A5D0HYG8_9FLAO|nr:transporter [Seonamhaeicola marinus]TYA74522.1 transporter [Seonamhaeicola marinus]
MILKKVLSSICLLYFVSNNAQTCCSGGIPLSNNLGLPISEKGTLQIGFNYDYNNLNTLNNGTETLDDNSRLRITHSILLNTSYAITDNLSAECLFTWVNQRRKITQFGNENLDQTSGVGDAVLLLKYNFAELIGRNTDFTVGLGTKIPLGSSTETNSQGITLNADLQPGSNAWDLIYWASVSKSFDFRPSFNLSSRIVYRSTGTNDTYFNDSTYKFGNELQLFFNVSDQLLIAKSLIDTSISFKYRNAQLDKINGFDLDNTGGDWISLIPTISVNLSPNLAFLTRAEIPIYNNVDGTQLTPTYRITSGILFTLRPKPKLLTTN